MNSLFSTSSILVTGNASANATQVTVNGVTATLANGQWSASVTLPDGINTVTATAINGTLQATASINVQIDTTPPVLAVTSPANGQIVNNRRPSIQVSFSDAGSGLNLASYQKILNGTDITSTTTVSANGAVYQPGSDLPTGDNQVQVSIADVAGNITTVNSRFFVSVFRAIADVLPLTGIAPLTVTLRTRGEFTGGSIVRYRWDFQNDGIFDTSDSVARDYTYTYQTIGTHRAVLEVLNNLGQIATDVAVITVTGSPPQAFVQLVPSNGEVPLAVKFQGYGRKTGGVITKVEFDFEGDGTFDQVLTKGTEPKPDAIRFLINHANCAGGGANFSFFLNDVLLGTRAPTSGCVCNSSDAPFQFNDPALLANWKTEGGNSLKVTWGPSGLYVAYMRAELVHGSDITTLCMYDYLGQGCGTRDLCQGYDDSPFSVTTAINSAEQFNFDVEHIYDTVGEYHAVIRVTDSEGNTATASAVASVIRAGPPGTPSVLAQAAPLSGFAPLAVGFNASASDDGTIVRWEWDFQSDGIFDTSSTQPNASFTYTQAGPMVATVRATDNDGLTSIDTVEINVDLNATLTIPTDTFNPGLGQQVAVRTTLSAPSNVRIFLKNRAGTVVRDLVNASRGSGTFNDNWNGLDNNSFPLPHGDYYALLEYTVGPSVRVLDLTASTGGTRYNPSRSTLPNTFKPYEDNHLTVNFTVPSSQGASEIQAFIGLFNTDTRLVSLLERVPFGVGTHTIRWDGLDANGKFAVPPPGDMFLFGIWGYTLPNNAIFLHAAPDISNVTVDPNFFDPSFENYVTGGRPPATVSFNLSKQADVEVTITNLKNGLVLRRIRQNGLAAGARQIQWDGKADNGILVDKGDYRLGIVATDSSGSQSLVRYALVRVFY